LKPIANELLSSRAHLLFSFALKLQTIFKNFTNHFWHHYLKGIFVFCGQRFVCLIVLIDCKGACNTKKGN
ncbi:MAG: hypothetical protein ACK5JU_10290, partial [Bacteroidales bacterium]